MPSLCYSRRSHLWSLKRPLTERKENTGSWVHPKLQGWRLTLCFWHIIWFSQHICSPACIWKQEASLTLPPVLQMRNGDCLWFIGKKKIHSKLSPMPCLWFLSSSSFASNTQKDRTLLNLITSEESWVVSTKKMPKAKNTTLPGEGRSLHPFFRLRLSFVWLSTLTFSTTWVSFVSWSTCLDLFDFHTKIVSLAQWSCTGGGGAPV